MILETSFVIDFLKNDKNAVSKMGSIVDSNEAFGIAAPVIFELWTGLFAVEKSINELERINFIIRNIPIYPLDDESAKKAGKINGELIRKGQKIDPEDCMIAGIAISNNKKILTNDGHFKRIEGLKIEGY